MDLVDAIIWIVLTNIFIGVPFGIFLTALMAAAGRDRIDD